MFCWQYVMYPGSV